MNRVNSKTGQLISIEEIQQHLNASIPPHADLSELGYPFVISDPQPEITENQTLTIRRSEI